MKYIFKLHLAITLIPDFVSPLLKTSHSHQALTTLMRLITIIMGEFTKFKLNLFPRNGLHRLNI